MPQGINLSLTVGTETENYVLTRTQTGDAPTTYECGHTSGAIDLANIISHSVSNGPKNRNVAVRGTDKAVVTLEGIDALRSVNSFDVKLSFAKSSTLAERQHTVDLLIAYLTQEKAVLAAAETYF